jgi:PilZ domain
MSPQAIENEGGTMHGLRAPARDRIERRVSAVYPVYLTSDARQALAETAYTQDVSEHGARIVTRREWSPNDRLQVESIRWSFQARARVAYCEPVSEDEFAVGLQFENQRIPIAGFGA